MNDIVSTPRSTLDFDRPHQTLRIGSDDIAYWRIGSGPDVVLVHGWPLHSATWRHVAPALARHFTCHLVDLPGAGRTRSDAPVPLSVGALGRSLTRILETLDLERFALVAHDSGAGAARMAAAELGDRVWAIVMGNTEIPGHRPWLVTLYGLLYRLVGAKGFAAMLRPRVMQHSYLAYGSCFYDKAKIDGEFRDVFVEPLLASPEVAKGQMRLLEGFDWADIDGLEAVHRRLTAPVQLIWGRHDPFFPLKLAEKMQFPGGSELHVIDEAKLLVHEEAPERFIAHASAFLWDHAPR